MFADPPSVDQFGGDFPQEGLGGGDWIDVDWFAAAVTLDAAGAEALDERRKRAFLWRVSDGGAHAL